MDVDADRVERARKRHAGNSTVRVECADGLALPPKPAQFDRIIAWMIVDQLPQAWFAQTAAAARIVTPVLVAPVATANLVASAAVESKEPVRVTLHPGCQVDAGPDPAGATGAAERYVDARSHTRAGPAWLSALALHDDPDLARAVLRDLLGARRFLTVGPGDQSALARYLFARARAALAAVSLPCGAGYGIVAGSSAAFLVRGRYVCSGTRDALNSLMDLVDEWYDRGSPVCAPIAASVTPSADGWSVAIAARAVAPRAITRPAAGGEPADDPDAVPRPTRGHGFLHRPSAG
jgi:hypothetical protein